MEAEGGMDTEKTHLLPERKQNYGAQNGNDVGGYHCHGDLALQPSTNQRAKRALWISLTVCLGFMICEVVGGLLARSLAIITDAAHLLTDFASMLISLFSLYLANRPASQRMSFGWHRAEVLGAFLSVFLIWITTGILVYLAIDRIIEQDYDIDAPIMAITAALGVCINVVMAIQLYFAGHSHSHLGSSHHSHSHSPTNGGGSNGSRNINVRAAIVHAIGDLVQSVGVLVAAIVIYFNETWSVVDPVCTLFFSIIVLFTTIYIVRDALVVLLEGRPSNIDFRSVFDSLEAVDGVLKVHDLRIWSLTMDKVAISVHLEIAEDGNAQAILRETTRMLRTEYDAHECTVQIEGFSESMRDCDMCVPPH